MASTFSTNLAIELIGTGDQAGTWGVTTNTNLGTLIEQAISGYVTQAVATGTDTTITIPNGSTGVARNMYLELTGTGGTNTNLIVPSNKKLYFIFNNTTGAVTVKVSGQTGVSVPQGKKMVLVSNGTDIVNGLNYIADFGTNSFTVTNLTASSGTITNLIATTGTITTLSATSGNISNLVSSDASATVLRAGSATLTHLSATSASITNLALTSLTISSLSITNVSVASATVSSNLTLSAGTANGVLYLNGSKVATSGSALVFDGTNLGIGMSSPAVPLDVLSNSGANGINIRARGSNDYGFLNFKSNDGSDTVGSIAALRAGVNSGSLLFYTGTTEKARLDTSGNLGIGTSSPNEKLDVVGNIRASKTGATALVISNVNTPGTSYSSQFQLQIDGTYYGLVGAAGYAGLLTSGSAAGDMVLRTNNRKILFTTNDGSTTSLALDTSGNLGLGVTPSAWASNYRSLDFNHGSLSQGGTGAGSIIDLSYNAYYNGTNWLYKNTDEASQYRQAGGLHYWYIAPSGTAGNAITFTQAMTLDASGNLGVGTTSPAYKLDVQSSSVTNVARLQNGTGASLYFYCNGSAAANSGVYGESGGQNGFSIVSQSNYITLQTNNAERARIDSSGNFGVNVTNPSSYAKAVFVNTAGSSALYAGSTTQGVYISNSTGTDVVYNASGNSNGSHVWQTGNTERARITSGGYFKASDSGSYIDPALFHEFTQTANNEGLQVRVTNASYGNSAFQVRASRNTTNNSYYYISCYNDGAANYRLRVADSGDVTNVNGTYGTISDAKMKTDIVDAGSQWDDIKAVRFRKFKMKDDPSGLMQLGVVAQELEQTSPGLVDEHTDKDDQGNDLGTTTKSVKTSVLLMKAAVALQEAMARIEQLEAKVAALETK